MKFTRDRSSAMGELTAAARLRGLLDLARLVRGGSAIGELLDAVARVVSETLGFATVAINLYHPESDEYQVTTVHGNARARAILLGEVTHTKAWAPMLDPRFLRSGAFFIPEGMLEWDESMTWYTPELDPADVDDASAWRADDALFVTLDGTGGRRYGIISVDEPHSGRRPDDQLLEVLTALAAHAAMALESADHLGQLEGALARHRAVIESSLDAVIAVDSRGHILEFNRAAERIFGYRCEEVIDREAAGLLIPPEDRDAHRRALARAFAREDALLLDRRTEVTCLRADGSRLPVEVSLTLVETDESEPVIYTFLRDISEQRRGEEQLAYLAYHDPLTGLPNRILVEDQLELALARARRSGGAVALLFVDLDEFKEVNDKLGHAAGDQLLAAVATRLRTALRDSDLLARQGGDEFLVLVSDLEHDPVAPAESVGHKLLDALREPFFVAGTELQTGASIGVSLYPDDASDTEALLQHADAAMYRAKEAGGGRVVFHRAAETIHARRENAAAQLRRAITDDELELHYQPIWSLRGHRAIAGVEALLRWRHPARGLLKPDSFISLAEHGAVGNDLIGWVMREVSLDSKRWQQAGLRPRLSFDVFPHQLLAPGFVARLQAEMLGHDLDPGQFTIELPESAWTVPMAQTPGVLADLRAAGVSLAIADFGAGYSSLSHLSELEFDTIKIAQRLLTDVLGGRMAVAVLRAIVDVARARDAVIVAEGVESEEQAVFLAANGIDEAQGFLFGRPLRAQELTPLLARRLVAGALTA